MKLDIPFAYRISDAGRTQRRLREGERFRRSTVRLDVPEVRRSDMFLAFGCRERSTVAFPGFEGDYRIHEGRLLRPVLSSRGRPLGAEEFVGITSNRQVPSSTGLSFWAENPFMTNPRRHREWMDACLAEPETKAERDTFDEQRSARLMELGETLRGCVVADGILYRPTIEPVWGVSMFDGWLSAKLAVDAEAHRPTLAFKIGDESFADFCSEYRHMTGWKISVMTMPIQPDIIRFDHLTLPAEELLVGGTFSDITRRMREFEGCLRGHSKSAYEAICEAEADLDGTVWSGDALDEHLSAFRRIGDLFEDADLSSLSKAAAKRFKKAGEFTPMALAAATVMNLDEKAGYGM